MVHNLCGLLKFCYILVGVEPVIFDRIITAEVMKMDKKTMGVIAAGLGISAAVGMAAMNKTKNVRIARKAYHGVMGMKTEFADELGQMAKKAGKTMIKVGRTMDKLAK